MKKIVSIVSLLLSIPLVAKGVEFQTPGALGMGGAGVARQNGALTAYWNPAGGAFNKSSFAINAGVGVGISASEGLAENIDRLSKVSFDNINNFNTATANANTVGDVVKTLSILKDIETRQGNIAVTAVAPVSFSSGRFSFGVFANGEGYVQPKVDFENILPNTTTGSTTLNVGNLYDAVNRTSTSFKPAGYFSQVQLDNLNSKIQQYSTLTPAQSLQLTYAIDNQLNNSGIDANTALTTLTQTALPTLAGGGTNTLNKNTTSVLTKAVQYFEVPLSYGYPIDLGSKSKLGIGITGKVISGTVYESQILLVNGGNNVDSKDILNDFKNNKQSSVTFGIDLGALYQYDKWLSLGIVGKNLNSPKLAAPDYYTPVYNGFTKKVELSQKVAGDSIELKPQIRSGVAVDPVGWLTFAADVDLTENEIMAPGTISGSSLKSRNVGGGFELKPASWFKVRGGTYKNLASSNGNVLTAGFRLFLLDVDGAFATDTFVVNGTKLPREVQVQASVGFSF